MGAPTLRAFGPPPRRLRRRPAPAAGHPYGVPPDKPAPPPDKWLAYGQAIYQECGLRPHQLHRPRLHQALQQLDGQRKRGLSGKNPPADAVPDCKRRRRLEGQQIGHQEEGHLPDQARSRSQAAQERPGRTKPGCGRGKGEPPPENASTGLAGRISSAVRFWLGWPRAEK